MTLAAGDPVERLALILESIPLVAPSELEGLALPERWVWLCMYGPDCYDDDDADEDDPEESDYVAVLPGLHSVWTKVCSSLPNRELLQFCWTMSMTGGCSGIRAYDLPDGRILYTIETDEDGVYLVAVGDGAATTSDARLVEAVVLNSGHRFGYAPLPGGSIPDEMRIHRGVFSRERLVTLLVEAFANAVRETQTTWDDLAGGYGEDEEDLDDPLWRRRWVESYVDRVLKGDDEEVTGA